jgi:hypothetical protein
MRAPAAPREVPDIGAQGEHIAPFLYGLKVKSPKAFAAVKRALRTVIPAVGDLDVDLDTKRGTLDMENGVQPQRLERIAELLASVSRRGGAQIVVTTHSPGVAAMLERAESGESDIGLFSVTRDGRSSVVKQLRSLGLWQDQAIDELLEEPDTYDKITALIRRGWLEL